MVNAPKNETRDDSWGAFERAVDAAVKSGPRRRVALRRQFNVTDDMRIIFQSIFDRTLKSNPVGLRALQAAEARSLRARLAVESN